MGFIRGYLKQSQVDDLTEKSKDALAKLEEKLDQKVQSITGQKTTFEDLLKTHGNEISDLVARVSEGIKNAKFSLSTMRWVVNISIEVYQIVDKMLDETVTPDMSEADRHKSKIDFGKELTYFVWMTVDPLAKYLSGIPFRKSIEKMLVKWVAGYALEATTTLIEKNLTKVFVASADANQPRITLRAV